ncbi:initiation control protein YabA [Palaeococcus sp. (in: euryarchaeotes)]
MLKERICKDLYEEIERLERSIIELEDEVIQLKAQIQAKTEEVNNLAIENENLRYKLERLQKTYAQMVEILKKMKFPIILLDEDDEQR